MRTQLSTGQKVHVASKAAQRYSYAVHLHYKALFTLTFTTRWRSHRWICRHSSRTLDQGDAAHLGPLRGGRAAGASCTFRLGGGWHVIHFDGYVICGIVTLHGPYNHQTDEFTHVPFRAIDLQPMKQEQRPRPGTLAMHNMCDDVTWKDSSMSAGLLVSITVMWLLLWAVVQIQASDDICSVRSAAIPFSWSCARCRYAPIKFTAKNTLQLHPYAPMHSTVMSFLVKLSTVLLQGSKWPLPDLELLIQFVHITAGPCFLRMWWRSTVEHWRPHYTSPVTSLPARQIHSCRAPDLCIIKAENGPLTSYVQCLSFQKHKSSYYRLFPPPLSPIHTFIPESFSTRGLQ